MSRANLLQRLKALESEHLSDDYRAIIEKVKALDTGEVFTTSTDWRDPKYHEEKDAWRVAELSAMQQRFAPFRSTLGADGQMFADTVIDIIVRCRGEH